MLDLKETARTAGGQSVGAHRRSVWGHTVMLSVAAWLGIGWTLWNLGDESMVNLIGRFALAQILPAAAWFSIAHGDTGSRQVATRVGMHAMLAVFSWFAIGPGTFLLILAVGNVVGFGGAFGGGPELAVMAFGFLVGPVVAFYVTFRNAATIAGLLDQHAKRRNAQPGSSQG